MILAIALACTTAPDYSELTDTTETADTSDTQIDGVSRATIDGRVTWNVVFDQANHDAGYTDCSYTRHYVGFEDTSSPWMCLDCDATYQATVTLEGEDWSSCYSQVSSSSPAETELLGHSGDTWYRNGSARGPSAIDGATWTVNQTAEPTAYGAGTLAFEIAGTFTLGREAGDPQGEWVAAESYACGWPKADPVEYTGDWTADVGDTLPDGVFHDGCEEPVRLHDFAGDYLIIDVSAMDCPPCQTAAQDEPAFAAAMAAEGLDTHVITLLAPSLSAVYDTPTQTELHNWISRFDLEHSPVLADRAWGPTVGAAAADAGAGGFGYPTFLVVSPELEVLDIRVGFSSWDAMGDVIRDHAAE